MRGRSDRTSHSFDEKPNRTLVRLSIPVLFSLIAEPLTGLVDTAFVARLGADALAGLGAGTMALSSFFWIFNFLGIGTQTEVAQASGGTSVGRAASLAGLSVRIGLGLGVLVLIGGIVGTGPIAAVMGAEGAVYGAAAEYMSIRWLGAPAMLAMLGAFGALRGVQDMRTPLWIALAMNGLNIALDGLLIFGLGPVPALGIAGAAWASTFSQWAGAIATLVLVRRRLGRPGRARWADASKLFRIGADLFVRTAMLTLFLLLATRAATRMGSETGAAHQAVRQVWVFTALFLDAWAISAQSLVGFYVGAGRLRGARRVSTYACFWSVATGIVLAAVLWSATPVVARLLVPGEAEQAFRTVWWLALVSLPVGALTFATDGIHWGTGDFAYLRKATTVATLLGAGVMQGLDAWGRLTFSGVWILTLGWVLIRAVLGLMRVWPGVGDALLSRRSTESQDVGEAGMVPAKDVGAG